MITFKYINQYFFQFLTLWRFFSFLILISPFFRFSTHSHSLCNRFFLLIFISSFVKLANLSSILSFSSSSSSSAVLIFLSFSFSLLIFFYVTISSRICLNVYSLLYWFKKNQLFFGLILKLLNDRHEFHYNNHQHSIYNDDHHPHHYIRFQVIVMIIMLLIIINISIVVLNDSHDNQQHHYYYHYLHYYL